MITAEEARRILHNRVEIKSEKQLQEIEARIKESAELGQNFIYVKSLMQISYVALKEKGFYIEEFDGQRDEVLSIKISW